MAKSKKKFLHKVSEERDLKSGKIIYLDIFSQKKPGYGSSKNFILIQNSGWDWRITLVRQSEWYSACASRRQRSQRRSKGNIWQEQGFPTGRSSIFGYSSRSVGRIWRSGCWQSTHRKIMGRQGVRDGIEKPRPLAGSHVPTGWPSQPLGDCAIYLSRGVWDGRRRGRRCGFIYFTGISVIPSSYWRKETYPTHGAPNVTCWRPGVHWTEDTLPPPCAPRGWRGSAGGCRRRINGRVQRGPSRPMDNR